MKAKQKHEFTWKVLNWWACSCCGLLRLRNEATEAAIRAGCDK